MLKKFNPAVIYFLLWCCYRLQCVLYHAGGGIIKETQYKQQAQTTYTNLWELTHPEIETKTKTMVDQGNYTQALEQAIKTLTGTIARENKPTIIPTVFWHSY